MFRWRGCSTSTAISTHPKSSTTRSIRSSRTSSWAASEWCGIRPASPAQSCRSDRRPVSARTTASPGEGPRMIDLSGQVVVITGGNGGIGLGMAKGVAAAGADVAIWARDQDKTAKAIDELRTVAPSRRFLAVQCDVADPENVERAMAETLADLGRVDACVANAGASGGAPFLELTPEQWRRV